MYHDNFPNCPEKPSDKLSPLLFQLSRPAISRHRVTQLNAHQHQLKSVFDMFLEACFMDCIIMLVFQRVKDTTDPVLQQLSRENAFISHKPTVHLHM